MSDYSNELYISCLFPPSDNISGITVLKRIIENKKQVDVLHADSNSDINLALSNEADKFIKNRFIMELNCNFDWAECIFDVIDEAISLINHDYEKVYSRSWLMANHFIALEYKFLSPDVFWQAEFSDPLIYDLSNNVKTYKEMIIDNIEYVEKINAHIDDYNDKFNTDFPLIENKTSLFFICEYLTYLFADKIIFTNENQREIMLNQFPIEIKQHVINKTEIKPHPTLPEEYYYLHEADIDLDENYINIAYFGNDYYGKRHFESIFYAFENLNHRYLDKVKFYFYLSDEKPLKLLINTLDSSDKFIFKKPLDYLEFLNACTKFDVLLVNDTVTKGDFEINPYLPSKLSDYSGSNSNIWAMYECGSSLSKRNVKYKSEITDFKDCSEELVKILHDFGFVDENYTINDDKDYVYKRLTKLNELYEAEFRRKENFKSKVKGLKKINDDVMSSNSWRLTEPLRRLRK